MSDRPYTILSCGMSIDGYIEDPDVHRLALSNAEDFDRVDGVRAASDAILVGAATVRNDDPRLLVRSPIRREERLADGLPASPLKVTLTRGGDLDPAGAFFAPDGADKLVYSDSAVLDRVRDRLGGLAAIAPLAGGVRGVSEDLFDRGVRRLLVEGGESLHTQFLAAGLADELHLVVAPLFVGSGRARRFVGEARFPWHPGSRATLVEVRQIGDVALLRYALSSRSRRALEDGPVLRGSVPGASR
jgi:5-amino-6-(5-phosphoribosylamino)uracil reductase